MSRAEEIKLNEDMDNWKAMFDESTHETFKRINREAIVEIGELKKALCEFDCARGQWAEITANNVTPGRGSNYARRLEMAQGNALRAIDSAAWRLRFRLRGGK